jgi:cardiolipin synthase
MPAWLNAPNLITLVRLLLVPFVIQAILDGRHVTALAVFIAAATTDLLDGAAARRFQVATQAGAYLDPIADKCLLSGVFLALGWARIVPWWFVAIVLGRDLYILLAATAIMLSTGIRKFPPSVWGKASTFVQIVTVVTWLTRDALTLRVLDLFAGAILWVCAGFTIWSGAHYSLRGIQMLRSH